MALKVFPKRLAAIGAHVTEAPKSPAELMHIYFGGPIFTIQFEMDGHRGQLFNRLEGSEKSGYWEELICTYQ
ncbi:MAG TPA: hypothetical protein VMH00_06795 [Candidatus Limnocylindrales bacterium]|nr:hypothetical protein [Candidatus Limnocylindrales bacterium]